MASTSSSRCECEYDVFVSFRGADVRDGFLSHLFEALCSNQIKAFKDENLERGEEIEPALLQTIEESRVSIVILSENYAYSSWCLDELVKINDCKKEMGQKVLPVFYRIDPNHVEKLTGSYGDAFVKHAQEFQDKVESWRLALTETSTISGFVSKILKPESKLVGEIVNRISEILNEAFSGDPCDDGLVGMESRLKDVEQLLDLKATTVRFLGVWGMGGIGKTTLASIVFERFSSQFQGQCFMPNVREALEHCTLAELQRQFLDMVFGQQNLKVGMPTMLSSSIRKQMMRKKVLIVLDDIWKLDWIKFLVGKQEIYAPGSRIIITSRDRQILSNIGAEIYQVKELDDDESLQLFSMHAFKKNSLPAEFMKAARKAVMYAHGNPLALQVLGSSLHGKQVDEWEDLMKKLENISDKEIEEILRLSFDVLDENEKQIFLDIACFFKSEDKKHVESVLENCFDRAAKIGISRLIDKCLINISDGWLEMHDLLEQLGKDIVRMQCVENPGNRSRLWDPEDIYRVLSKDEGSISVESMSLDVTKIGFLELSPTTFVKMSNLRFLKFYSPFYTDYSCYGSSRTHSNIHLSEAGLNYLSDELRYVYWYRYPLKIFPFNCCPEKLIELHLIESNLQQLCNENQCLQNLKVLDLSHSKYLIIVPDLSELPKLEVLRLRFCSSLVEIGSSVVCHNKLSQLDLQCCENLCSLPEFFEFKNLDFLSLDGCSKLREFPKVPRNLKSLGLIGTAILEVPPSLGRHSFLTNLQLRSCEVLHSLPSSIGKLKCLVGLDLSWCSKLSELPEVPCNIEYLFLDGTAIEEVPSSIGNCLLLSILTLRSCVRLESLPSSIGELKRLEDLHLSSCSNLKSLPDELCDLKALESFSIDECQNLNELPKNMGNLESLKQLNAQGSGLKQLPRSINLLRELEDLNCHGCTKLILPPLTGLVSLSSLDLKDCGMTEVFISIGSLVQLRELDLDGNLLKKLPTNIGSLVSLTKLCLAGNLLEKLPTSIGSLVSLTFLDLSGNRLKKLPTSISSLVSLTELYLSGNRLKKLPDTIGSLVALTTLHLAGNRFKRLPTTIEQLSGLKLLNLQDCMRLKCLSDFPSSLEDLNVKNCTSLESMLTTKGNVNDYLWYVAALNCVNLNANSCRNIMDEMLQRFENYSQQLKAEDFYEGDGNRVFDTLYRLGVPSDEVPQRMKYRNDNGCFLQYPLRQESLDLMILNFCAVVASNDHSCSDLTHVECECNLETECGRFLHHHFTFQDWPFQCNWSAKHVFLWQGGFRFTSKYIWDKASFKFNVTGNQGLNSVAVVIKCGVDIFYEDNDIDSRSIKRGMLAYYNRVEYGSTEEETRANCDDCQKAQQMDVAFKSPELAL